MDLASSSNEKLAQELASLRRPGTPPPETPERVQAQAAIEELQVHRIELEMQNRALREMQGELESAIQRYSDLYDNLPIAYVTLTPKGRIVEANTTALQWFRRERTKLIGSYINWFLDPFDAGRLAAHLESVPSRCSGGSLIEVTLRLDEGLLMTVQLSSCLGPTLGDGVPTIHTAITNIPKLRQAHRVLDDINREHDSLDRSIAQDLREPVVAISDYARSLLQEHGSSLTSEAREIVERMEGASFRLDTALQHLLVYCQLGGCEIALDPVSLEDVVQTVLLEHRALIQQRHAEVHVARPLPCVRGSRLMLGQVFSHLLKHVIDSAAPGELPRVHITSVMFDRMVTTRIANESGTTATGDPERAFSLFERGAGGNGGICLTVVRRVVERMSGRISIDSTSGNGSCFLLELPAI
jgi:signal transduction histidine kinase